MLRYVKDWFTLPALDKHNTKFVLNSYFVMMLLGMGHFLFIFVYSFYSDVQLDAEAAVIVVFVVAILPMRYIYLGILKLKAKADKTQSSDKNVSISDGNAYTVKLLRSVMLVFYVVMAFGKDEPKDGTVGVRGIFYVDMFVKLQVVEMAVFFMFFAVEVYIAMLTFGRYQAVEKNKNLFYIVSLVVIPTVCIGSYYIANVTALGNSIFDETQNYRYFAAAVGVVGGTVLTILYNVGNKKLT